MKKYLFTAVLIIAALFAVQHKSQAAALCPNGMTIVSNCSLLTASVIDSLSKNIPGTLTNNPASSCLILTHDLQYPNTDTVTNGEVSSLQNFLHTIGKLASPATGNFGMDTFSAVKSFQTIVGIPSTGFVGAQTRAMIKKLSCN